MLLITLGILWDNDLVSTLNNGHPPAAPAAGGGKSTRAGIPYLATRFMMLVKNHICTSLCPTDARLLLTPPCLSTVIVQLKVSIIIDGDFDKTSGSIPPELEHALCGVCYLPADMGLR